MRPQAPYPSVGPLRNSTDVAGLSKRESLKHRLNSDRRGAAIVELAMALPVFVLIVLGTIEATSMIFLRQSLEICAYEGARVALVPDSEEVNVRLACQEILNLRGIDAATIAVTPSNIPAQDYGTPITVQVTANCAANSLFPPWFYVGRTTSAEVTMMKE